MAYTLDQVISRISTALGDTSTAIWGTAEIGAAVTDGLAEIATYKPRITLATATPSAGTPDLDISGTAFNTLLYGRSEESFEAVEFKVDQKPKRFRNFEIHQNTLTMDIEFSPNGTDAARLYCRVSHILGGSGTTSLTPETERLLIDLVAARLAINESISHINAINKGGAQTVNHYITWGERKLSNTLRDLRNLVEPKTSIRWPTVQ
jgi:hypothetical protein